MSPTLAMCDQAERLIEDLLEADRRVQRLVRDRDGGVVGLGHEIHLARCAAERHRDALADLTAAGLERAA